MIKNYLKIAIRGLYKRKVYFGINVIGLSTSIAICLILFVFIQNEWSHDTFHERSNSIYRVQQIDYLSDDYNLDVNLFKGGGSEGVRKLETTLGIGSHLVDILPDVKRFTRFSGRQVHMQTEDVWMSETWHFADSSFFDIFSFPIVESSTINPLGRSTDLVISRKAANQYFGNTDVMGKQISVASGVDNSGRYVNFLTDISVFEIVAVVDVPSNSSLQFDFLIPTLALKGFAENTQDTRMMFYSGSRYSTFLEISDNVNVDLLQDKINDNLSVAYKEAIDILRERRNLSESNPVRSFELVNIEDIRFETELQNSHTISRSRLYSLILLSIGILITCIVCINCITLNLGTLGLRGNELGVRKVLGAQRRQLALQFYLEGAIQLLIASAVAFTLMQILLPLFNRLTDSNISMIGHGSKFLVVWAVVFIVLSFVIGFYPLLIVTRFRISEQLNGWSTYKIKPMAMKWMIGIQLAIGVFLFVLVVNMKSQFEFLLTTYMGFDKEHVLVLEELRGGASTFKSELEKSPLIEGVTLTNSSLFAKDMFSIWWNPPGSPSTTIDVYLSTVDENFLSTLDIKLKSGRYFENGQADATSAILINETLQTLLKNSGDTTGKFDGKHIIGVISDFNMQGLTHSISPLAVGFKPSSSEGFNNAYIKIAENSVREALEATEKAWSAIYPDRMFGYKFLDDRIEQVYQKYSNMIDVVGFLSALALLFTFMGLFGLMSILVINKFKEIGVRKVFGASSLEIYLLLSKDFVVMAVIVSLIIAYPAYHVIDKWLENFAYFDNKFVSLFLLGLSVVIMTCMAVISFHTVRISRLSPVRFIRNE